MKLVLFKELGQIYRQLTPVVYLQFLHSYVHDFRNGNFVGNIKSKNSLLEISY